MTRELSFSMVTLNMAKETGTAEILRQLRAVPRLRDADVFLMQEVKQAPNLRQCVAEELAAALGRHVTYSPAATGVTDQGLAILSRYPLRDVTVRPLPRYDLVFHSRSRIALSATLETPAGPVRITNAHLDTRVNGAERVGQLTPVLREKDGFAGPRIVAGDFNTNNFYWLGHVIPLPFPNSQTGAVEAFMARNGYTSALPASTTTFDHLGMHVDWVFANGLRPQATEVIPLEFSDHHAVWVELRPVATPSRP